MFVYICVDVHMSFCTLTLTFLCLLCGLPLPIFPLNRIFLFSDPGSFIVYVFVVSECHKMHLGFKDSTLCSKSLELLVVFFKSQNVMGNDYYDVETLYQNFFFIFYFLFFFFFFLYFFFTGNSDSHTDIYKRLQKIPVLGN